MNKIVHHHRQPVTLILSSPIFDREVLALRIASLLQPLAKCGGHAPISVTASERTSSSSGQYFQFKPTRSTLPSNFWLAFMKSSSAAVNLLAGATE